MKVERYEIEGFKFNRLFNKMDVDNSRINFGYVEYHCTIDGKNFRWYRRFKLVWLVYKKKGKKRNYHIHHKNMNKLDDRPSNLIQVTGKRHCEIHNKVYTRGIGGSERNLGHPHSEETKQRMSISMTGNTNLPEYRDKNWCDRIKKAQYRIQRKGIKVSIREVVKMYCNADLSYRDIASMKNISRQVIRNRLDWFMEDNFDYKMGLLDLRDKMKGKDLNDFYYYDEEERLESCVEYKVIGLRVRGMMFKDIISRLGLDLSTDVVKDMMLKFCKANGLGEKLYLKDIRKIVRQRGLGDMIQLMKDYK